MEPVLQDEIDCMSEISGYSGDDITDMISFIEMMTRKYGDGVDRETYISNMLEKLDLVADAVCEYEKR